MGLVADILNPQGQKPVDEAKRHLEAAEAFAASVAQVAARLEECIPDLAPHEVKAHYSGKGIILFGRHVLTDARSYSYWDDAWDDAVKQTAANARRVWALVEQTLSQWGASGRIQSFQLFYGSSDGCVEVICKVPPHRSYGTSISIRASNEDVQKELADLPL